MTFTISNTEYKNLHQFMLEGAPLPLQIYLESQEEINNAINNDFEGIYTITLFDSENNPIESYELVYIDNGIDDNNEEFFWMKPMYFPDDLFLKYYLGQLSTDVVSDSRVEYTPCNASYYETKENEVLDYSGTIRPLMDGEIFIQDKGINYLVEDDNLDEIKNKGDVMNRNYFDSVVNCQEAIEDNYEGYFIFNYVYFTGEHLSSVFQVNQIDDNNVSLNIIDLKQVNGFNTPEYIILKDDDGKETVKIINTFKSYEYIPSSDL